MWFHEEFQARSFKILMLATLAFGCWINLVYASQANASSSSCNAVFLNMTLPPANDNQALQKLNWSQYKQQISSSVKHLRTATSSSQRLFALRTIGNSSLDQETLLWDSHFDSLTLSMDALDLLTTESQKPNSISYHLAIVRALTNIGEQNRNVDKMVVNLAVEALKGIAIARTTHPAVRMGARDAIGILSR